MSKPIVALAFAAIICGGLTGCPGAGTTGSATDNQQTVQKAALGTCGGYDTALLAVKPYIEADKLSIADLDQLDKARAVGIRLCGPGAPVPTDANGIGNELAAATAALVAITAKGAK
jgi:hypothetical protein